MPSFDNFISFPQAAAGALLGALLVTGSAAAGNQNQTRPAAAVTAQSTAPADFDFLNGDWRVKNRRLVEPLQNSSKWEEFGGSIKAAPLLNGLGSMDELSSDDAGLLGMSVRYYNRETREWSEYWVSNRDGVLQPPVTGRFKKATAILFGSDQFQGKPIRVRYIWSRVDTPSPRWEQAFSADDGKTWETNWVMDLERL